MPSAAEGARVSNQGMAAVNAAGMATISQEATVTFTEYVRVTLPLDGSAFWVRNDLLSPTALYNAGLYNGSAPFNASQTIVTPAPSQTVKGSLHYTTVNNQDEAEGFSINRIIFTTTDEVELLNEVNPTTLYIGVVGGIRFAFSRRTMLYRQAGLFHYQGDALYPAQASQIIDHPDQLNTRQVVSNSLPFWLTLNAFCPMYPSYLIPDDIVPPYCAVHIEPGLTKALQSAPYIDQTGSHWQLTQDHVRLTFYGLRNFNALAFQDYMFQYTLDTDNMGLMGSPVMRDEKRTQAEMNILAQKKTFEMDVSYYQFNAEAVARQLILSCIPTYYIEAL